MTRIDLETEIDGVVAWIRERVREAAVEGCVVGLSGGVDSAVTAALCMRAFPKTSLGILMPHSEKDDSFTRRGKELAEALSMPWVIHPIGEAHRATVRPFEESPLSLPSSKEELALPLGNLRSRLRMCILYLYGNSLKRLVVGTGNRDEDYGIGYFTKYGDGGVDISPIADFHKSEVYELGRLLAIPDSILSAPPSAGLWDGQTDEDELGMSYDEIERASRWLESAEDERGALSPRMAEVVEEVTALQGRNRHKLEPPPVYRRITRRSFS